VPNYCRAWIPGGTFFFTVAIADRTQDLLIAHIEALREAYAWTLRRHPFRTRAIVILPDHLHAIWTLPADTPDFALRWKLIKEGFSRRLPRIERLGASRRRQGERGVWQRRYWEHAIRDDSDLAVHLDYVHFNPVKHAYVERPEDWPYSSYRRFVGMR